MSIVEKVSYIKGLLEGLNLDEKKPEVKVINSIVDLLDDISSEVSDIQTSLDGFVEQLDEVDEDLGNLEEDFYCLDDEDDDFFYEVTCPTCKETVCLSKSALDEGEIECPNCGENLEFDFDDLCLDDHCDCHENNHCDNE